MAVYENKIDHTRDVEALHWDGSDDALSLIKTAFPELYYDPYTQEFRAYKDDNGSEVTPIQKLKLPLGSWIITRDIDGSSFVLTNDLFNQTYQSE